ncbi:unnamed protein product, partial [Mesorhabditis belari]|uniref:Uncharacterized protein n=1 Tax=Mesorhabditis belari TaxID=2138241 RepID=A0AAF3F8N2_9BILA
MDSLKEAIGLIPRNFYVIKIGSTTESLRTEEAVLKRCEKLRVNLENEGLIFAKKFSFLSATREEAKKDIDAIEKKPPPVFIIIDDYDGRTIDRQLAHGIPSAMYFTGYSLLNCMESAVRGRCSAFVNAMIKLWSGEGEKKGKTHGNVNVCSKCGVSGQICKCIEASIEKVRQKHACGYDNMGPELYALISRHMKLDTAKDYDTAIAEVIESTRTKIKLSPVSKQTFDNNDSMVKDSTSAKPSNLKKPTLKVPDEPLVIEVPLQKPAKGNVSVNRPAMSPRVQMNSPVVRASASNTSVNTPSTSSHKSIAATIFEAGPNLQDVLELVHKQTWDIGTLTRAFENNCRQAQNLLGSKKPNSQAESMNQINMEIRNGLKSDRHCGDMDIIKCWAIVVVYHSKILRIMMTIGNTSVELTRAVQHPRLYKAIRFALENPKKYTPNETVHTLIDEILDDFQVAIREHDLEQFLSDAFLKLHRIAVTLAVVYLSHQLAKCASVRGLECHDVTSDSDLRNLVSVAKVALTAGSDSVAEKTGEFFSTWQRTVCVGLPELNDYKLLHFVFKPDFAMPF